MDRELVAFVGAGLQVLAAGVGAEAPAGAIARGYEFVEHLSSHTHSGIRHVVVDTVAQVWADWRSSSLPRVVGREHIAAIPRLLERYRLEQSAIISAVSYAGTSTNGTDATGVVKNAARRLAAAVVAKAARASEFSGTGLSEALTFFFLERLFERLLLERRILRELKGTMALHFATLEREGLPPDETDPAVRFADLSGVVDGSWRGERSQLS